MDALLAISEGRWSVTIEERAEKYAEGIWGRSYITGKLSCERNHREGQDAMLDAVLEFLRGKDCWDDRTAASWYADLIEERFRPKGGEKTI